MVAPARIVGVIDCPSLPMVSLTLDARALTPPPQSGYTPQPVNTATLTTSPSIGEAVGKWVALCLAKGQAKSETSRKALAVQRFAERVEVERVSQITEPKVDDWLSSMVGRSSNTICNQLCQIRGFCDYCVRQGWLRANPAKAVEAPRREAGDGTRALSSEEVHRVLVASKPYRRPYYVVAALTGLRPAECKRLRWKHVDLRSEHPTLYLDKHVTKSRRKQTIPIPDRAVGAFAYLRLPSPDPDALVFENIPTLNTFNADLARAGIAKHDERGRSAGLSSLRKHLATALAKSGADIYTAQSMLRHASATTTERSYVDKRLMDLESKVRAALDGGDAFGFGNKSTPNGPKDLTDVGLISDSGTSSGPCGDAWDGEVGSVGSIPTGPTSPTPSHPTRLRAGDRNVLSLSESELVVVVRALAAYIERQRI